MFVVLKSFIVMQCTQHCRFEK